MATIINNPSSANRADEADGASDLVIGIIAAVSIVILILFLVYGLPVLQSSAPVNTAVTPSTQNIRVELPSQAQTQTPTTNQTPASQPQGTTNY